MWVRLKRAREGGRQKRKYGRVPVPRAAVGVVVLTPGRFFLLLPETVGRLREVLFRRLLPWVLLSSVLAPREQRLGLDRPGFLNDFILSFPHLKALRVLSLL